MNTPSAALPAQPESTPAAWYGLMALLAVGLFGFLDRQIFALLAEPMKKDLGLSDLQLGLLQGLSVSIFAAVATYPIAWLADRHDRRRVLAGCVAFWSLAVVGCAAAPDFTVLFIASALVGVGEAGLGPVAYGLIPAWFHGARRQLANSINVVAGRLGIGLVTALCGWLIVAVESVRPHLPEALQVLPGWRLSLLAAAMPAPLLVLLILSVPRGESAEPVHAGHGAARPMEPVWPFVRRHRVAVGSFFLGVGAVVFGLAAISAWLPVVAMRQFGATTLQVGNALGLSLMVSAAFGLFSTYLGVRALQRRFGPAVSLAGLVMATVAGALCFGLLPLAGSADGLFLLYTVQMSFLMTGYMLYPTVMQEMAPARLRGRMTALGGMVILAASAASPPLVGLLSDHWSAQPDGLLLAACTLGSAGLAVGAVVMLAGLRHYAATVDAAREADAQAIAQAGDEHQAA